MKILSDEEKEEKLENDWDGLDQLSLITCVQEYTLRQVVETLDGIENPHDDVCDAFGVECPFKGDARGEAIQTIKESLQQAIEEVKE